MILTLDSETMGFCGPIVLFQWGLGDGEVHLEDMWDKTVQQALDLFEFVIPNPDGILGFNLAFDWFKIQQMYTTLLVLKKQGYAHRILLDIVDAYALAEPEARDGPCCKPTKAMDLMLFARKGPYQSLMNRDPIVIKRIPTIIAPMVVQELERRIKLPDIFFAKAKKAATRWKIKPLATTDEFVNIELNFAPSSALKALATHELGLDPLKTLLFSDIEVDRKWLPKEHGFAPFALAVGKPGEWNGAWPEVVHHHRDHWKYNTLAREYATKDIIYPRELWKKWGSPELGDMDSNLACLVGASRWKGFAANLKGLKRLAQKADVKMKLAPRSPQAVMAWLKEVLSEEEQMVLEDEHGIPSTKRVVLEEITKLKSCDQCLIGADHASCTLIKHPAAGRASLVLESRKGKKEKEVYEKLILAGRFHVSANVIGTRSSRMSGGQVSEGKRVKKSGNINPQGIQRKKFVRAQFQLAFTEGMAQALGLKILEAAYLDSPDLAEVLCGGDFDKFEVGIADAYYNDPQLHEDLTGKEPSCDKNQCRGKCPRHDPRVKQEEGKPGSIKIHAVIGTLVYPGKSYWDIRMTDGAEDDLYNKAKSAFFALIYFGNEYTLATRLGIPKEDGSIAYAKVMARYPVMAEKRKEFAERFCPVRQPGGLGTEVVWVEPEDNVESMLGFKRYYTSENEVIKALYHLQEDIPRSWRNFKIKVRRRDREQTVAGSVRSAIIGAAFQVQQANMRSAGNHVIQSTGAQLTKMLQIEIWEVQPCGIHPWLVRPMNVHDELPTACAKRVVKKVKQIQMDFIERHKSLIPMIGMKWRTKMANWAGK